MTEEWRPIPGWEDFYEASTEGRIRSLARYVICMRPWGHHVPTLSWRKARILSASKNSRGYRGIHLRKDGDLKIYASVQSLVALTFIGPRPPAMVICHNNGDQTDNRVTNLRYDTQSSNTQDALRIHKTMAVGANSVHWRSDIDEAELLRLRAEGWTYTALAARYGIGEGTVGRIIKDTRQRRL